MLYQNGDEPIEYTTAAGSPGRGLTSGMLEAGATYAVLLTEILDRGRCGRRFLGLREDHHRLHRGRRHRLHLGLGRVLGDGDVGSPVIAG